MTDGRTPSGDGAGGRTTSCPHEAPGSTRVVSTGELLEILGDEYARRILALLVERPRTGRELSDATDMSRPTVYRRLETLRDSGLVRSEVEFDPNGHHRKRFHAAVSGVEFDIGVTGIEADVRTARDERTDVEP